MKKTLLFITATSLAFGLNIFKDEQPKDLDSHKISDILKKEVKELELDNTKYKIVDINKYKSTGIHEAELYSEIKIEGKNNRLSSMTYKLKNNIWYFIKVDNDNIFKFFEYNAKDQSLFGKNNFYIKVLKEQTNILFKTKHEFEPLTLKSEEKLKFIVMGDELKQLDFTLSRIVKEIKNEK